MFHSWPFVPDFFQNYIPLGLMGVAKINKRLPIGYKCTLVRPKVMVSVTKMDGITKQAGKIAGNLPACLDTYLDGWVNVNYFYYTIDNWQALDEGKPPSNGLIRWHAAISLRPEFQIVPKLYDDFFHFRILCFSVLPELNRTSQLKFCLPNRTEQN